MRKEKGENREEWRDGKEARKRISVSKNLNAGKNNRDPVGMRERERKRKRERERERERERDREGEKITWKRVGE